METTGILISRSYLFIYERILNWIQIQTFGLIVLTLLVKIDFYSEFLFTGILAYNSDHHLHQVFTE